MIACDGTAGYFGPCGCEDCERCGRPATKHLYVLQVREEWRTGRGLYWRPDGCGYTDDIRDAGRWTWDDLPPSTYADPVCITGDGPEVEP